MSASSMPPTRRGLLIGAAVLTGLPIPAVSQAVHAAGTLPKANVHYQDRPNARQQHCGMCNFYISGPTAGQCKVVAGAISPYGWCILFVPKGG
jgi:hypothetical protein